MNAVTLVCGVALAAVSLMTIGRLPASWFMWLAAIGLGVPLSFALRWPVRNLLAPKWNALSPHGRITAVVVALFVGVFLTIVLPFHPPWTDSAHVTFLEIAGITSLAFVSACVWTLLTSWSPTEGSSPRRFEWLAYAGVIAASLVVQWLIIWPGGMTPDSFDQWSQLATGQYRDWHPAAHTFLLWLVTRIWHSPAAVVLVHVVVMSLVIGRALWAARRAGVAAHVAWMVTVLVAVLPGTLVMLIVWKDVTFSVLLFALSASVFRVVARGGSLLDDVRFLVLLGFLATLAALVRANAPLASFGTFLVLGLAYRASRKPLAVVMIASIFVWVGTRSVVQPLLGVESSSAKLPWWQVHQLSAHSAVGTSLTDEEKEQFFKLSPDTGGVLQNDPYRIDATVFAPGFQHSELRSSVELTRTWRDLLVRRPLVNLRQQSLASQLVWQVWHPPAMRLMTVPLSRDDRGAITGLHGRSVLANAVTPERAAQLVPPSESKLPKLLEPLLKWQAASWAPRWSWLAWGGAFPLYLLVFGALVAARRRNDWRWVAVAAPAALNSIGLLLFSVSAEFRFIAPTFFCGFVLGPLLLCLPKAKAA